MTEAVIDIGTDEVQLVEGRLRVGALLACTAGPAVVASLFIVAARVLTLLGTPSITLIALTGIVLGAAIAAASLGLRGLRSVRISRPSGGELGVTVLGLGSFAMVASRTFHWSFFSPTTYTVDAAHHAGLVAWIAEHGRIPSGVTPELGTLSGYPPWAHVVPALLADVTRLPPITSLWLVALGSVVLQWPLVALLCRSVSGTWATSVVPMLLMLLAWRFTIGLVTWDFFFAQAVSLFLAVAGVTIAATATAASVGARIWVPSALLVAAAAFLTYPQQGAIVPLAVVAAIVVRPRIHRLTRRNVLTVAGGAALLTVAALAVLRAQHYLNTEALLGNGEGAVTLPSMQTLGGWLPGALAATGVVYLISASFRRQASAAALLAGGGAPALLAAGLWLTQHGYLGHLHITSYRIAKNVYAAVPFAAAAAGVAVWWVVAAGRARSGHATFAVVGALSLLVASRPQPLAGVSTPLVSRDAYTLATWARHHLPVTSVGLVGPALEPYTLWYAGLLRPIVLLPNMESSGSVMSYLDGPMPAGVALTTRSMRWVDWPNDATTEQYLLVSGTPLVQSYLARPNVALVRRRGTAAILRRAPGANAQAAPKVGADTGHPEQGAPGLP